MTLELTDKAAGKDRNALLKLALFHLLLCALGLSLYLLTAGQHSNLAMTSLAVTIAAASGFVLTTLVHEWFHLTGAFACGGQFRIPRSFGLFTYNWDFDQNNVSQFMVMSVAGSLGSVVGIALLWPLGTAPHSFSGAALLAGAIASLAFGGAVEWPVLVRTLRSGQPLAELSKITPTVLIISFAVSVVSGLVSWQLLS
jgi:hypothetical protein